MDTTSLGGLRFGFAILFALGAIGCAGVQKIPVDQSLWSQKQTKIGVAIAALPEPAAHRVGAQGLLDLAINAGMASDLEKHLKTLEPSAFAPVLQQFEGRLRSAGFATKRIAAPVDVSKLPDAKTKDAQHFGRDIGALAAAEGVDAVLLVSLVRWGTLRSYYGFMPLGDPKALFQVVGRLISRDGRLRWQDLEPEPDSTTAVDGEWDQAPGFPNVTLATRTPR
jgi:hypothetical protein